MDLQAVHATGYSVNASVSLQGLIPPLFLPVVRVIGASGFWLHFGRDNLFTGHLSSS